MSAALPQFTIDQISQLAPDEQSLTSARQLLSLRYWTELGMTTEAIWGLCQGSAKYLVKIELSTLTMNCQCPSRKRPCRHALGLLLLLSSNAEVFRSILPPPEVEEWLKKRKLLAEKKRQSATAPLPIVDEVARQKRSDRREQRVLEAVASLRAWMKDLIFNGLAAAETHPDEFWERQAKRLVDLQATGLANRIRTLAEIPGSGLDWPQRMLSALGMLELLMTAFERIEDFPVPLQSDIRQLLGWNVQLSELQSDGRIESGIFTVLSVQSTDDDRFKTQKVWIQNVDTAAYRLVLQFAPGRQSFEQNLFVGSQIACECLVYPGQIAHRVRLQNVVPVADVAAVKLQPVLGAADSIEDMLRQSAEKLAMNPFAFSLPVAISQASIVHHNRRWFLRDQYSQAIPLLTSTPWNLLAVTGGAACKWFGEWDGNLFSPLAMIVDHRIIEA